MRFQQQTFADSLERLAYLSQTRFDYVHFENSIPPKAQRPAFAPLRNSLNSSDGFDCSSTTDLEAKLTSDDNAPKPPIEIQDEEATSIASSAVQLFDERYIVATSLDNGCIQRQLEFETFEYMYLAEFFLEHEPILDLYLDKFFMENEDGIPTSAMHSDKLVPEVVHGKSNGGVEHDEGFLSIWTDNMVIVPQFAFQMKVYSMYKESSNIVVDDFKGILRKSACPIDTMFSYQYIWNQFPFDPIAMECVWDPGISSMFLALTGSTENAEELLLLGCTCKFPFSNFMIRMWDPGEPWCVTSYILQSNSSLEFLILLLALHDDYKVQYLELDISEKFLVKDITDAFRSNLAAMCFNKRLGVRYYTIPGLHLKFVLATFGLAPESLDGSAKWHGKTDELQCMWSNINMWLIVPRYYVSAGHKNNA